MLKLAPRPSQQDVPQHGLVSLLEMIKRLDSGLLANLGKMASLIERTTYDGPKEASPPKPFQVFPLEGEDRDGLLEVVEWWAEELDLSHIQRMVERRRQQPVLFNVQLQDLYDDLIESLEAHKYFAVTAPQEAYFGRNDMISEHAKLAFPTVAEELREAADCYALSRNTACVFHAMRAAELGVKQMANDLDVPMRDDDDMKKAVDGIRAKARAIEQRAKYDGKKVDSQFYSEVALEAGLFKDAWRNHCAHGKVSYDADQAKKILDAVCSFYEHAATRPSASP